MTAWHVFRALLPLALVLFQTTVGLCLAAIWTESDKLGETAAVTGTTAALLLLVAGMWASEGSPNRPLPRAERKALREEEARIEFDRKVRQAEIDAGLRERPDPYEEYRRSRGY